MATQMYLIVGTGDQTPPVAVTAWLLDVQEGQSLIEVAQAFVVAQNFPFGSQVYVVNTSDVTHLVGALTAYTP